MAAPAGCSGGLPGGGGLWGGRGGALTGAQYQTRHERDAGAPGAFGSTAAARSAGTVDYAGAAGAPSGARYEVVHKYSSSHFVGTAPFANNSTEWIKSVGQYRGPRVGPSPYAMHSSDDVLFEAQRHTASLRLSGLRAPSPAGSNASGPLRAAAAAAMQGAV
eukprot:TRINITY_DN14614_c0_g2_i2.p2 TRINITY_DN14614_c0_g2~~TRINITY_DN14614_c0_g2_i2.p2  ORF type:complete len:180 (+),score=17.24 TRINITY_DN14614_c0_g2_i2:57-542(+)